MNARRLDWHVLLPRRSGDAPSRWILLGPDQELPRLAVELGLTGDATNSPGDGAPADVVALLHGAPERLEQAIQGLAPGGLLYWEVDRTSLRRLGLTPGRARRRLRAIGLAPLATYLVGPRWSRPSRFVPVDRPGPLAWYLDRMGARRGFARSWFRRMLRVIARSSRLMQLLVPRFAVVAVAGPVPTEAAPAILADPGVPPSVRSSSVAPILIGAGEGPWGRIALLAFETGAAAPSVVIKIARHAEFNDATRHEHEVLLELRRRVDADTRSTLPNPIALLQVGPRAAVVQNVMRGSSVSSRASRPGSRSGEAGGDLERTTDWLISLHAQTTASRIRPGSPGWVDHVSGTLDRFCQRFGAPDAVARLLDRVQRQATSIDAEIPIVLRHMDLGPWNVLIEHGEVGVIDWEVARDGPALTDLVYAALHWSLVVDPQETEPARRRRLHELFGQTATGHPHRIPIRDMLHRYCLAMGIDERLIPTLAVLTFVDQALDRFDRLQVMATPDAEPWVHNRYVGYVEEFAAFGDDWLTVSDPARPPRDQR